MKRNLGDYDVIIRLVSGLCLMIVFIINDVTSPLNWLLFPLSGILLLTGLSGSCPLYRLLHIDTRGSRKSNTPSH
ncbi:YgaP family membrane protein [Spirosoma rigui]|uniref:YgaP family membrane protein n=1 Tax=Spirosoma rigui TaxID=564064 RepID=UPI0009B05E22